MNDLFCELLDMRNALYDSKDVILKITPLEEYDGFTRGYVSALECCIKIVDSIINREMDNEEE